MTFTLVYGCLKMFLQQQKLINVEYESDWEWMRWCFVIQNPALLSRDGTQFAISQLRHAACKPGIKARTTRLRTRRPGHSVGFAAVFCVHFVLLLSAAFLLSKKETRVVVVIIIFHSSPAAQSLRCRMLPIKTLEQRNLKLSIFCSTLFPFSLSHSCSGWMRWKAKQGDTVRHYITSHCLPIAVRRTALSAAHVICPTFRSITALPASGTTN